MKLYIAKRLCIPDNQTKTRQFVATISEAYDCTRYSVCMLWHCTVFFHWNQVVKFKHVPAWHTAVYTARGEKKDMGCQGCSGKLERLEQDPDLNPFA